MLTAIRIQWLPKSRNPASTGDDSRGNYRDDRADIVGGVEGAACEVVVYSWERELISRSNKKILCGGCMNDQLEANKRIVREWNDLAINQRKPEEAVA